jgi:hypothetical protein
LAKKAPEKKGKGKKDEELNKADKDDSIDEEFDDSYEPDSDDEDDTAGDDDFDY